MPAAKGRATRSRELVIDASILQASGGQAATHPLSKHCRDFLSTVLKVCHVAVLTHELSEDRKVHVSNFARRWRVSMEARKKIHRIPHAGSELLASTIENVISGPGRRQKASDDFHLIEAALVTDGIIASVDEEGQGNLLLGD